MSHCSAYMGLLKLQNNLEKSSHFLSEWDIRAINSHQETFLSDVVQVLGVSMDELVQVLLDLRVHKHHELFP